MSGLIVLTAIASIAVTALLTLVLYRINGRNEGAGDAGHLAPSGHDSGSDGGDGGGD